MNPLTNVKNITKLNELELSRGMVDKKASWHEMYKDSAWIFIGGLTYGLTEGDIVTVFSQYGEIVNINLVRDKKTGKTKGFCFVCYTNQKSTTLAVDNFNGIKLCGRTIRVDHVANYKAPKEDEKDDEITKMLKSEGCAPKAIKVESSSDEDDEPLQKKHKKSTKEKTRHKEQSENEAFSLKKVKIEKKQDPGYDKYELTNEKFVRLQSDMHDIKHKHSSKTKSNQIREGQTRTDTHSDINRIKQEFDADHHNIHRNHKHDKHASRSGVLCKDRITKEPESYSLKTNRHKSKESSKRKSDYSYSEESTSDDKYKGKRRSRDERSIADEARTKKVSKKYVSYKTKRKGLYDESSSDDDCEGKYKTKAPYKEKVVEHDERLGSSTSKYLKQSGASDKYFEKLNKKDGDTLRNKHSSRRRNTSIDRVCNQDSNSVSDDNSQRRDNSKREDKHSYSDSKRYHRDDKKTHYSRKRS